MVKQGKKATHKCFIVEGSISGFEKVQGPVSKLDSVGCHGQFNSSTLHKQTRRNSLSGDVCSPVETHDMVPSLQDNPQGQTHYRVPEVMADLLSRSNQVQVTEWSLHLQLSKGVHSSCRSICHSCEPRSSIVRISCPRPKCQGYRCSKHRLVGSHCLCLPSHASPSHGDPKNPAIPLPHNCYSPRLARDALVLGPSAALDGDPTPITSVNDTPQTVPQPSVSQQPTVFPTFTPGV